MNRPYSLTSARYLAQGRTDDKSVRTAGMRAKTDPPLSAGRPRLFKLRAWLGRVCR